MFFSLNFNEFTRWFCLFHRWLRELIGCVSDSRFIRQFGLRWVEKKVLRVANAKRTLIHFHPIHLAILCVRLLAKCLHFTFYHARMSRSGVWFSNLELLLFSMFILTHTARRMREEADEDFLIIVILVFLFWSHLFSQCEYINFIVILFGFFKN